MKKPIFDFSPISSLTPMPKKKKEKDKNKDLLVRFRSEPIAYKVIGSLESVLRKGFDRAEQHGQVYQEGFDAGNANLKREIFEHGYEAGVAKGILDERNTALAEGYQKGKAAGYTRGVKDFMAGGGDYIFLESGSRKPSIFSAQVEAFNEPKLKTFLADVYLGKSFDEYKANLSRDKLNEIDATFRKLNELSKNKNIPDIAKTFEGLDNLNNLNFEKYNIDIAGTIDALESLKNLNIGLHNIQTKDDFYMKLYDVGRDNILNPNNKSKIQTTLTNAGLGAKSLPFITHEDFNLYNVKTFRKFVKRNVPLKDLEKFDYREKKIDPLNIKDYIFLPGYKPADDPTEKIRQNAIVVFDKASKFNENHDIKSPIFENEKKNLLTYKKIKPVPFNLNQDIDLKTPPKSVQQLKSSSSSSYHEEITSPSVTEPISTRLRSSKPASSSKTSEDVPETKPYSSSSSLSNPHVISHEDMLKKFREQLINDAEEKMKELVVEYDKDGNLLKIGVNPKNAEVLINVESKTKNDIFSKLNTSSDLEIDKYFLVKSNSFFLNEIMSKIYMKYYYNKYPSLNRRRSQDTPSRPVSKVDSRRSSPAIRKKPAPEVATVPLSDPHPSRVDLPAPEVATVPLSDPHPSRTDVVLITDRNVLRDKLIKDAEVPMKKMVPTYNKFGLEKLHVNKDNKALYDDLFDHVEKQIYFNLRDPSIVINQEELYDKNYADFILAEQNRKFLFDIMEKIIDRYYTVPYKKS